MKLIRKFKIEEHRNPYTGVKSFDIYYQNLFGKWKPIQNRLGCPWRFVSPQQAIETVKFLNSL